MTLALRWHFDSAGRARVGGVLEPRPGGQWVLVPGRRVPGATLAAFPGLVNAHCHLELTPEAPPAAWAGGPFADWARGVMAWRNAAGDAGLRAAVRRAVAALLASGVVAVGEIESAGQSTPELASTPLRGRIYREVVGFDVATRAAARARLRAQRGPAPRAGLTLGLSPHAPYSVSAVLFRACRDRRARLAIHAAETAEEVRFLATGDGPLRDLLQRLGKLPPDWQPPRSTPIAWLDRLGLLSPRTLLIHAHHLMGDDVARLRRRGACVVVCPGTLRFFGRTPPPVRELLAARVPVALGTDSLASNQALDLTAEMAGVHALVPGLAPASVLTMATRAGWRALGLRAHPGDLCLVRAGADAAGTLTAFTHGQLPVLATLVGGRPAWTAAAAGQGTVSLSALRGL